MFSSPLRSEAKPQGPLGSGRRRGEAMCARPPQGEGHLGRKRRHSRMKLVVRTESEIEEAVRRWEPFVHPRAGVYFADPEQAREVMRRVFRCIGRQVDPLLGGGDGCVIWHGETRRPEPIVSDVCGERSDSVWGSLGRRHLMCHQPVLDVVKPGDTQETMAFASRVLALLFASDESMEELMLLPKEPFRMCCGHQECIRINHISLDP
mmetsp:Transcript_57873/g.167715  ORF Transcript_57873/g.167715 Transcript_57873/m.167715 type:complete len:207 (+) Transcript_57873:37-657(+)